jgi:hypothetical protein
MSKTKQQAAAEERASRKNQSAVGKEPGQINGDTGKVNEAKQVVAEQPKTEAKPAATTTPATPATPSKQEQTIETLKAGWTAKGVDLSKLTIKDDGKFRLLVVAEGWPTVQVGASGGVTVLELKSYAKAFDAAMDGLALYQKQQAREAKKTAAAAPPAPPAAKAEKQSVSA